MVALALKAERGHRANAMRKMQWRKLPSDSFLWSNSTFSQFHLRLSLILLFIRWSKACWECQSFQQDVRRPNLLFVHRSTVQVLHMVWTCIPPLSPRIFKVAQLTTAALLGREHDMNMNAKSQACSHSSFKPGQLLFLPLCTGFQELVDFFRPSKRTAWLFCLLLVQKLRRMLDNYAERQAKRVSID